jgi:hypothetical protein
MKFKIILIIIKVMNFSNDGMYVKINKSELLTVKGYNYNNFALKIQKWWRKYSTLKELKRLKIKLKKRNAIYISNNNTLQKYASVWQDTTIIPTKRKFNEIEEKTLKTIPENIKQHKIEEKTLKTIPENIKQHEIEEKTLKTIPENIKQHEIDIEFFNSTKSKLINFIIGLYNNYKFW